MFEELETLKEKLRELGLPGLENRRPGGPYPWVSIPAGPEKRRQGQNFPSGAQWQGKRQ